MATAVICEFNPFHNGHKYLIESAKKITGEPVIAIMSGSFTQRGETAVTDKFSRAHAALKNGADLVLELPAVYAVSSAQRFAKCGAHIAKSFKCVKYLTFGCETCDLSLLSNAADAAQNPEVQKIVADSMKSGDYYPRAFERAVRQVYGKETADVLSLPNNILAVEYIRNLRDSHVQPLPTERVGAEHDSSKTSDNIASASYIRRLLRRGETAEEFIPCAVQGITYPEKLETAWLYRLREMSAEDFRALPEVSEGLENRIVNAVNEYNSIKEIINAVKTKRYTHARIRRILCCALLRIDEEIQNTPVEYVRVLGFNREGAALLKSCCLKVVTSASDGIKLCGNIASLLKRDIFASDVASLAYKVPRRKSSDYVTPIITEV